MRYCVLGGGGSFGLHTSDFLLRAGDNQVLGIGRAPPKAQCFTRDIGKGDKNYSYRQLHVTYEFDFLMEALDAYRPQVIVNFCAQGESATSLHHSWRYYETNCVALSRLVGELRNRDYLERFIHIGTSELYGSTEKPAKESDPIRPTSPYAVSKAAFDLHLMALASYGFPMNILRPSNAYGEGQQLHRIIPKAVLYGLTGRKLPLHGGGVAEKSYIHSEDLARAIYLVAAGAPLGKVYNVGPRKPTSIRKVVEYVAQALQLDFEDLCEVSGDREHQDSRYWLDSSAIVFDLHWRPMIDWGVGLGRMAAWGRRYLPQLMQMPTEFVMRA